MAALSVFHLDDPNIRIEIHLSPEVARYFTLTSRGEATDPPSFTIASIETRRRRSIESNGAVESINAEIDRPCLLIAAAHHHGGRVLDLATAQIGFNPDLALNAHGD
jgi:hypothetical protein